MAKDRRGPRGKGSVHFLKKRGAWRATGYAQTPDGPRFVARERKLQGEAIAALDAAVEAIENPAPKRSITTVADYVRDWLANTARPGVSARTYERYEGEVRLHVAPAFEDVALQDVTAADVRRFKQAMVGVGLAPSTVGHAQGVLSTALNQAVADGAIPANPCSRVRKPREARTMRTLSAEQAGLLVASVVGTRDEAAYLVALKLGPRPGELSALFWEDVDFGRGEVVFRRSVDTHHAGAVWGPTKTGEARTVALPGGVLDALGRHRALQAEERMAARSWKDGRIVFPNRSGGVMRHNQRGREFARLLERAGLPKIRLHDCRHTAATLMLQAGVPVPTVSQILGHKNATQTLNRYSHVLTGHQAEAAKVMDRLPF